MMGTLHLLLGPRQACTVLWELSQSICDGGLGSRFRTFSAVKRTNDRSESQSLFNLKGF